MIDPETGAIISFNGEIYNFPELRSGLAARGVRFATRSDTEVILKLYVTEGAAALTELRGMYAVSIWDPRSRQLVAARDPFGIKPLYVWNEGSRIAVSSQVRALSCGLPDAGAEADALLEYGLFGHVVGRNTPVRGVREVPPGSVLCFNESGAPVEVARTDVRGLFDATAAEGMDSATLAAALEEAVGAHTLSDVPIGILLSAGTDSTAVASRLAATADPALVSTFTIAFKGMGDDDTEDEAPRAALIAKSLGFRNHSDAITPAIIEENLQAYLDAMDQPSVDAVNTYFAARLVRRHSVKVALLGTGGDELFGGYSTFRRTPFMASPWGRLAVVGAQAARGLGRAPQSFNSDKLDWMRSCGRTLTGAYLVQRGLMAPEQVARLYGCEVAQAQAVFDRTHDMLHEETRGIRDRWSAVSYLETRFYLMPRLLRDADWAGMAHSVELRTPLVDWVLWRSIRALVAAQQRRKLHSKQELMSPAVDVAAAAHIPTAKLGFGNPYGQLARIAGGGAQISGSGRAAPQQRWAAYVLDRWSASLRNTVPAAQGGGSAC